jgi:hypothetical protein
VYPNEYTSALGPYCCLSKSSGADQCGVPDSQTHIRHTSQRRTESHTDFARHLRVVHAVHHAGQPKVRHLDPKVLNDLSDRQTIARAQRTAATAQTERGRDVPAG